MHPSQSFHGLLLLPSRVILISLAGCHDGAVSLSFILFLSLYLFGDQPELSKCMMPSLINHKSKLVEDRLELKGIAER